MAERDTTITELPEPRRPAPVEVVTPTATPHHPGPPRTSSPRTGSSHAGSSHAGSPHAAGAEPEVSGLTVLAYGIGGLGLAGRFLHLWLVQQKGLVVSAGEVLGITFAVLLGVSVIGTVRRAQRP